MPRKAWLPAPPEAGTPSAKGRIRFHRHREGTVGVAAAEEEDGRRSPGCNTARRLAWQSNKGAAAFPGASLALPKELRWETNRPA